MTNELTSVTYIKSLFQTKDFFAKKSLGQNFLIDRNVLSLIIKTGDIESTDHIIEIGPGIGTLTKELAIKAKKVIAIEKDRHLEGILRHNIEKSPNIDVIFQDALNFKPPSKPYKVIANIPYYITSPLINHFLKDIFTTKSKSSSIPPKLLVLLIQKEVAEKICAKAPSLNVLALNIQTFAQTQLIKHVSSASFHPQPKVDSALIKIIPYEKPLVKCDLTMYFKLISSGFSQKRKQIHNSLAHGLKLAPSKISEILTKSEIDPQRRPETINIQEWERISTNVTPIKIE